MRRIIIISTVLLFVQTCVLAQISTPEKRKFNLGLYAGLSVWKYRPMAAVDISYRGTTLRLMPNFNYYSAGITQEILKISPVFYNLYWTASVYGGYGLEKGAIYTSLDQTTTTYTFVGSTGLKTYFSKRWYSHVMAGVMFNSQNTPGLKTEEELVPYFEFGIGANLFKTYPNLKREETEE